MTQQEAHQIFYAFLAKYNAVTIPTPERVELLGFTWGQYTQAEQLVKNYRPKHWPPVSS